jgi:putative intracellular protease/amidase
VSFFHDKRRVDVVLFHGFELLDVFGPLELYGKLSERFEISLIGLEPGAVSNKQTFDWAVQQGPHVSWVRQARWTHDRSRWTSAGIAAGMDMTLAIIASICGQDMAE